MLRSRFESVPSAFSRHLVPSSKEDKHSEVAILTGLQILIFIFWNVCIYFGFMHFIYQNMNASKSFGFLDLFYIALNFNLVFCLFLYYFSFGLWLISIFRGRKHWLKEKILQIFLECGMNSSILWEMKIWSATSWGSSCLKIYQIFLISCFYVPNICCSHCSVKGTCYLYHILRLMYLLFSGLPFYLLARCILWPIVNRNEQHKIISNLFSWFDQHARFL